MPKTGWVISIARVVFDVLMGTNRFAAGYRLLE